MKSGKKPKPRIKIARSASETTAQGLELGTVAIAITIVVLVPVVLDTDALLYAPHEAYAPLKFEVFMGFSAALLVTVLGVVVLRRGPLGVPVLIPALAFLGVSALSALLSEDPWHSLFGDRKNGLLSLAGGFALLCGGESTELTITGTNLPGSGGHRGGPRLHPRYLPKVRAGPALGMGSPVVHGHREAFLDPRKPPLPCGLLDAHGGGGHGAVPRR